MGHVPTGSGEVYSYRGLCPANPDLTPLHPPPSGNALVLRRLTLACATATLALPLSACGGGSPASSPEAAAHPTWVLVAETICPGDSEGSLAEHRVSCTGEQGKRLEATFYDAAVDLDRKVSTFECTTGMKSVAGKDWLVAAVSDAGTVSKLLDAGGINLC